MARTSPMPSRPRSRAAASSDRSRFPRCFRTLTVLENVRIGLQRKLGTSFHFWKSEKTLGRLDAKVMELLESVDLATLASVVTVDLPYGRKRALEIATTLAMEPELMLLDEPT